MSTTGCSSVSYFGQEITQNAHKFHKFFSEATPPNPLRRLESSPVPMTLDGSQTIAVLTDTTFQIVLARLTPSRIFIAHNNHRTNADM